MLDKFKIFIEIFDYFLFYSLKFFGIGSEYCEWKNHKYFQLFAYTCFI
jgi:hypothetical protein